MTCTAAWIKSQQWSDIVQITNYHNAEPLSDNTKNHNYNFGYVTDETSPLNFWQKDDTDPENSYKSEYRKNSLSRQDCTAVGVLYGEKADGSYNAELRGSTGLYWDWFKMGQWTFTSGHRLY